jgi:hypothetical protein
MLKEEMLKEIEELKAQLDQLKAQSEKKNQEQSGGNRPDQDDEHHTGAQENTRASSETCPCPDIDIGQKIQELIKTVDEELKEASPITVLVVFAVGVLMGRLLPK